MPLDFGWTCGGIDSYIKSYRDDINSLIMDLLDSHTELPQDEKEVIAKDCEYSLYQDFESAFESVRSTNEDMRKQADYQIGNLEDRVSELESEVQDLNQEIESLNQEINALA